MVFCFKTNSCLNVLVSVKRKQHTGIKIYKYHLNYQSLPILINTENLFPVLPAYA